MAKSPKPMMAIFKENSRQITQLIETDRLKFLDISWDFDSESNHVKDFLFHIQSQVDALFTHFSVNHLIIDSLFPSVLCHLSQTQHAHFVWELLHMLSKYPATTISFLPIDNADYLYPIFNDLNLDQILFWNKTALNYTSFYLTVAHKKTNNYRFLPSRTGIELVSMA